MATEPIIDWDIMQELIEFCGDDALVTLVDTFLEHAPRQVEEIVQAAMLGDCCRVSGLAHTLRSSAGSMGLMEIPPLAAELEHLADQQKAEALPGLAADLQGALERAETQLRKIEADPTLVQRASD